QQPPQPTAGLFGGGSTTTTQPLLGGTSPAPQQSGGLFGGATPAPTVPAQQMTPEEQVRQIYQKYNAAKMGEIPGILQKYAGQLPTLLQKLVKKYNVAPGEFGIGAVPGG
ncbi:unnamed protein product, partial [Amoebophrya sp. A25]